MPFITLSMFTTVILVQIFVIVFISFLLKIKLNNMLLDLACGKVDYWKPEEGEKVPAKVVFVSHKPLDEKRKDRVRQLASKRMSPGTAVEFLTDKSLWGGAVVTINAKVHDVSLKDRLKQAWP